MKVFLNPGHDTKYDSGAVNPDTGLCECDVALHVGRAVQHYLELAGLEARLMQSDNLAPVRGGRSDYSDRQGKSVVETANDWGADIFVSIHCNSAANPDACGTETYAYDNDINTPGGLLADCIQKQVTDSLGTVDRGTKSNPDFMVLKYTDMPAVLVELAFISNAGDAALLEEKQDAFARAVARGITDYENLMQD